MSTTDEGTDSVTRCYDEQCSSTDIEHRLVADPIQLQSLDEWKCNGCGLRWARWLEPSEAEPVLAVMPW